VLGRRLARTRPLQPRKHDAPVIVGAVTVMALHTGSRGTIR
jgi:hypothetical protein